MATVWFVKRRAAGWHITWHGWVALLVFTVLLLASLLLVHGVARIVLTPILIAGFLALSVGKIDLTRLDPRAG